MIRMLIIDDEPFIVDGLIQMFHQLDLGLDVYKAYSAIEAVSFIKKVKVDIVISDIRMPEKNGLQLMDELMYYWPKCKVIFLTGYDEFDYVYTAIEKKAQHYILKTEEDEVLINAVKQCIAAISAEESNRTMLETAARQIGLMGPLIKKEIFESILYGKVDFNRKPLSDDIFQHVTIHLNKPILLIVAQFNGCIPHSPSYTPLQEMLAIQQLWREQLIPSVRYEELILEQSLLVWLLQLDEGNDSLSTVTYLKGVVESVQNKFRTWHEGGLKFIFAKEAAMASDLHEQYAFIKSYLAKRQWSSQDVIVDLSVNHGVWSDGSSQDSGSKDFMRMIERLKGCLQQKHHDGEISVVCKEVIEHIRIQVEANYFIGVERYYSLLLVFLNELNSSELFEEAQKVMSLHDLKLMEVPSDWTMAASRWSEIGEWIQEQKANRLLDEGGTLVATVQRYIRAHLNEDLTLVRIAAAMFFNPSYLSRYYKQHAGHNISEFIHEYKLQRAKELLANPDLKINEIAEQLGFNTASYFTSFFRKMTSLTPQEYRDKLVQSWNM